jgi:large repetitive protein
MKSFHFAVLAGALVALSSPISNALGDQLMQVHVFATDFSDTPIASIEVGSQYKLRTEVQDIRDPVAEFPGVFAAAGDISFSSSLSSIDVSQTVEFGSFFNLLQESTLAPGGAIGWAATSSLTPPGNAPQFLFSVVLTATSPGTQVFVPDFSTDPSHENLLYGKNEVLIAEEIQYVGSTLTIVPEPSTILLGTVALVGLTFVGRRRRKG